MLIRLAQGVDSMSPNQASLKRIQNSGIDVERHEHLQVSLSELASARNRCKDVNRIVLDLTFRYSELFILAGCYGRVVRT